MLLRDHIEFIAFHVEGWLEYDVFFWTKTYLHINNIAELQTLKVTRLV